MKQEKVFQNDQYNHIDNDNHSDKFTDDTQYVLPDDIIINTEFLFDSSILLEDQNIHKTFLFEKDYPFQFIRKESASIHSPLGETLLLPPLSKNNMHKKLGSFLNSLHKNPESFSLSSEEIKKRLVLEQNFNTFSDSFVFFSVRYNNRLYYVYRLANYHTFSPYQCRYLTSWVSPYILHSDTYQIPKKPVILIDAEDPTRDSFLAIALRKNSRLYLHSVIGKILSVEEKVYKNMPLKYVFNVSLLKEDSSSNDSIKSFNLTILPIAKKYPYLANEVAHKKHKENQEIAYKFNKNRFSNKLKNVNDKYRESLEHNNKTTWFLDLFNSLNISRISFYRKCTKFFFQQQEDPQFMQFISHVKEHLPGPSHENLNSHVVVLSFSALYFNLYQNSSSFYSFNNFLKLDKNKSHINSIISRSSGLSNRTNLSIFFHTIRDIMKYFIFSPTVAPEWMYYLYLHHIMSSLIENAHNYTIKIHSYTFQISNNQLRINLYFSINPGFYSIIPDSRISKNLKISSIRLSRPYDIPLQCFSSFTLQFSSGTYKLLFEPTKTYVINDPFKCYNTLTELFLFSPVISNKADNNINPHTDGKYLHIHDVTVFGNRYISLCIGNQEPIRIDIDHKDDILIAAKKASETISEFIFQYIMSFSTKMPTGNISAYRTIMIPDVK